MGKRRADRGVRRLGFSGIFRRLWGDAGADHGRIRSRSRAAFGFEGAQHHPGLTQNAWPVRPSSHGRRSAHNLACDRAAWQAPGVRVAARPGRISGEQVSRHPMKFIVDVTAFDRTETVEVESSDVAEALRQACENTNISVKIRKVDDLKWAQVEGFKSIP